MNKILIFGVLLLAFSFQPISAQSFNFQIMPTDNIQIGYSFQKPFYSSGAVFSLLSGVHQLSLNIPISSKFNIIGDIPYMTTTYEYDYGYEYGHYKHEKSGFCNIFIGMQTNPEINDGGRSIFTFGLFLPTAEVKQVFYSLFTNYYELQKYVHDSFGIYFNYAYHKILQNNFFFGVEVGPNILIPTEDDLGESEIFIHFGVDGGYLISDLAISAEFLAIAIVTQSAGDFGDRFVNQINFGAQYNWSVVSPKVFYRIYFRDDITNIIDGVLGLGLSVSID